MSKFRFGDLQPVDLGGVLCRILGDVLQYEHGRFGVVQDLLLLFVEVVVEQVVVDVDLLLLLKVLEAWTLVFVGVREPLVAEDVQDGVFIVRTGRTDDSSQSKQGEI